MVLSSVTEIGTSEKRIKSWISSKRKLSVFSPIQAPSGPDYADGEIVREIRKRLSRLKPKTKRGREKTPKPRKT